MRLILKAVINNYSYGGKLIDENAFFEAINDGFNSEEFRKLIMWISNEISDMGTLDEKITSLDLGSFLIELSGFLKELQGSYEVFTSEANVSTRMKSIESRYLLLEFLISELMAQKMFMVTQKPNERGNVITIHETTTAAALKEIAITLNLGKPPDNIAIDALFTKINTRLDETLRSIPDGEKRIGLPLFKPKNTLKDEQWAKIDKIHAALNQEYNLRKKMLMTRLDVTIQSFKWSDSVKGKERDINEKFSNKSNQLDKLAKGETQTDIAALLAARDKLAIIEKTSSANVSKNTKSKLQRHIIGKVPDRGGRALDKQKPPAEMPSWAKRQPGNDRGGARGGGNFNLGNHHQQQQQYKQRSPYNPSNQDYGQQQPQTHYQENNRGGGGGARVQGGWNQRGNVSYSVDNQQKNDDYQQNFRGGWRGRGRGSGGRGSNNYRQ